MVRDELRVQAQPIHTGTDDGNGPADLRAVAICVAVAQQKQLDKWHEQPCHMEAFPLDLTD